MVIEQCLSQVKELYKGQRVKVELELENKDLLPAHYMEGIPEGLGETFLKQRGASVRRFHAFLGGFIELGLRAKELDVVSLKRA